MSEEPRERLDSEGFTSDTTCASTCVSPPSLLWHGLLGVSLRYPPTHANIGWLLGYQPLQLSGVPIVAGPDIPLCTEAVGKPASIHRGHMIIGHLNGTGTTGLKTVHSRPPTRCDGAVIRLMKAFPLPSWKHFLDLGKLQYWVTYVQLSAAVAKTRQQETKQYIENIQGTTFVPSASATPSKEEIVVGAWTLKDIAGRGQSSIMIAALNRHTGELAVARSVNRSDHKYDVFKQEVVLEKSTTRALAQSRYGASHIQRLLDSIEHAGTLYAFYSPLCVYDLKVVLDTDDYSDLERQTLFAQLIYGIQALHAIGRIHGDIKPRNICLRKRAPLHLAIVDTASIILTQTGGVPPDPGHRGTIGYLAPEQESCNYGTPVDIWAAGCVGIELLLREKDFSADRLSVRNPQGALCNIWRPLSTYRSDAPSNGKVARAIDAFHAYRTQLGKSPPGSREELLCRMIDPVQSTRITADDVVNHCYVRAVSEQAAEASQQLGGLGFKRKYMN